MPYTQNYFYTKDKQMQKYLDDLMKDMKVRVPTRVSQDLGRTKAVRSIREMNRKDPFILMAEDTKCRISIIELRAPLKIKKDGNKYIFSL